MKTDLKIVKKEIHEYLIKNDWIGHGVQELFIEDNELIINIECRYLTVSPKSKDMFSKTPWCSWDKNIEYYDRYFLEYIGSILRKYKIKKITINPDKYTSDKWTFDTIKLKYYGTNSVGCNGIGLEVQ